MIPPSSITAIVVVASMALLEISYVSLDYTRGFLVGLQWLEFYSLCLAALFAILPILYGAAVGLSTVAHKLDRHPRIAAACVAAETLGWILYFEGMLFVSRSGRHIVSWIFSVAILSVVWGIRHAMNRKLVRGGPTAVASLAALLCNTGLLWCFRDQFFGSGFSITGTRPLLTTVAAAGAFVVTSLFLRGYIARPMTSRGIWVFLAWTTGAVGLYHLNATVCVDNYLWAHQRFFGMGILCAWAIGEWTTTRFAKLSVSGVRRFGTVAVVGSAAFIIVVLLIPRNEPSFYVAAVHTRFARQVLEISADTQSSFRIPTSDHSLDALLDTGHAPVLTARWSRPNLEGAVLFLLDMKRPQDIALYRQGASSMPKTAACFKDSFRFLRDYSSANVTRTAFPGMFSSAYGATRKDHQPNGLNRSPWALNPRRAALGAVFKRAGYRTAALVGGYYHVHFFKSGMREFAGFDTVTADGPRVSSTEQGMWGALRRNGGIVPTTGRFLSVIMLQMHSMRHIGFTDQYIGTVCDELKKEGRYNQTVLLLTADHGYQEREHGRKTYGHSLFNEEILVPHVLRVPGMQGYDVKADISSLDILPSLIDLFGIRTEALVEGESYVPLMLKRSVRARRLFSESRNDVRSIAVIEGAFKLIRWSPTGAEAMFDMSKDPGEKISIAALPEHGDIYRQLHNEIDKFLKTRGAELVPNETSSTK